MLAILGTSDQCIASNPSDQNVALTALEATIHVTGTKGERAIPIGQFYTLPGQTPERETVLEPGDLVTHVTLPPLPPGVTSLYLKLRDRTSYEFALVSAAVVVKQSNDRIEFVRVALGGVGTIPWRSHEAERALQGKAATPANFRSAAEAALRAAKPQSQNGFKVELAKRCLTHALTHNSESLIAIQLLDGVANAIFGVVSILVVADRTRATGRFNLSKGASRQRSGSAQPSARRSAES